MSEFAGKNPADRLAFLIIGHRGACAYAPENTAASIEEAMARGADMVEFDLRQTADGVIVLFHDRIARSVSGRTMSVSKLTYHELSAVAEAGGYRLATFEEILALYRSRISFDIEIKVRGFEEEVIRLLDKHPPVFEPMITSFVPGVVRKIKRIKPSLRTGLILGYSRIPQLNIFARPIIDRLISGKGVDSVHLHRSLVSESILSKLRILGVEIHVWTVNDPEEMKRLLTMGVNGIVTDGPDVLHDVCRRMAGAEQPVIGEAKLFPGRFAYTAGALRKA